MDCQCEREDPTPFHIRVYNIIYIYIHIDKIEKYCILCYLTIIGNVNRETLPAEAHSKMGGSSPRRPFR